MGDSHSLPMMMGHRGLMWVLGALLALGLASAFSPDPSPPCADTATFGGYTCAQIVASAASACTEDQPGQEVGSAALFRQACQETCGDCSPDPPPEPCVSPPCAELCVDTDITATIGGGSTCAQIVIQVNNYTEDVSTACTEDQPGRPRCSGRPARRRVAIVLAD